MARPNPEHLERLRSRLNELHEQADGVAARVRSDLEVLEELTRRANLVKTRLDGELAVLARIREVVHELALEVVGEV